MHAALPRAASKLTKRQVPTSRILAAMHKLVTYFAVTCPFITFQPKELCSFRGLHQFGPSDRTYCQGVMANPHPSNEFVVQLSRKNVQV
jgi:hypothetical protein